MLVLLREIVSQQLYFEKSDLEDLLVVDVPQTGFFHDWSTNKNRTKCKTFETLVSV